MIKIIPAIMKSITNNLMIVLQPEFQLNHRLNITKTLNKKNRKIGIKNLKFLI